jgi:hypothetical protein
MKAINGVQNDHRAMDGLALGSRGTLGAIVRHDAKIDRVELARV